MESIIGVSAPCFFSLGNLSEKGIDSVQRGQRIGVSTFWVVAIPFIYVMAIVLLPMKFLTTYWLRPLIIKNRMAKQGVLGPTASFLMGNLREISKMREEETSVDMSCLNHDIVERLLPHFVRWSKLYGKRFILWWGIEPRMLVTEPDLIKEVLSSKNSFFYGKSYLQQKGVSDFIGKGLLMANGDAWAHQRRIVAPAFNVERLKKQLLHMVNSTLQMTDRWKIMVNEGGGSSEIEVTNDLSHLAGDIIARTIFGNSFQKGKTIFDQLISLQKLSSQAGKYQWLPMGRLLPISIRMQRLKLEVENCLKDIIQTHRECQNHGDSLLELMVTEAYHDNEESSSRLTTQQLMDECKTFFFAGHDTTALLLSWTMMLLAAYPSWQERARHEILNTCGTEVPSAESLGKLKILGMILNESLRLYTPASLLARQAFRDIKLGELRIPKGLSIWIPTLAIHHDKENWGADADEFKPQRFAEGVSKACKHPMGFLPFSYGPRSCVGQALAMMETKLVLAMILTRFTFRLSPSYRHAPVFVLTLKPKYGIHLILENLQ